jgi:hypothetical protein
MPHCWFQRYTCVLHRTCVLCCGFFVAVGEVRYIAPSGRRNSFFFSPASKRRRGPVDSNGIDFLVPIILLLPFKMSLTVLYLLLILFVMQNLSISLHKPVFRFLVFHLREHVLKSLCRLEWSNVHFWLHRGEHKGSSLRQPVLLANIPGSPPWGDRNFYGAACLPALTWYDSSGSGYFALMADFFVPISSKFVLAS